MSAVRKQFAIIVCVTTSRLDAKMSIRLKEHVIGKPLQQKKVNKTSYNIYLGS